jgi:beta-N-acetylhexosaminidase
MALIALCVAAATASVTAEAATTTSVNAATHRFAAADLTPRQLAGQRVACGFSGRRAPSGLLDVVSRGEIAGVILFEHNIGSRSAVQGLAAAIQSTERPDGLRQPVLISTDQEGGLVKRLPGPPKASAEQMGARGAEYSRSQGAATGASLRSYGINVDLAPVLDVARPSGFIAEQRRGFGTKPGRVASAGVAFAEGLESERVAATAKHFPGLGSTSANTDLRPATIPLSAGVLRKVDEAPYASYVAAGGDLVMVSSARYPALGTGKLPASQSKAVVRRELRGRLGFTGATISDSLETPGARAGASDARVATRAAAAGTDLLLYVHCDAALRATRALRQGLASGKLKRAPFEASVDRVLALRAGL